MVDDEAIQIVNNALDKGKTKKEVAKYLKEAGYSKEEIKEIMEEAVKEEQKEEPEKSSVQEKEPAPKETKEPKEETTIKEPEEETSFREPKKETKREPKKTPGESKTIVSLLISLFLNFWANPFKAMKDLVENKKYLASVIVLLIAFFVVFGNGMYSPTTEQQTGYTQSSGQMMQGMLLGGSNLINPSLSLQNLPVEGILPNFLVSAAIFFLPLLALIFVSTLALKSIKEKVKFREVARILSAPYSLIVIHSTILMTVFKSISSSMVFSGSVPWMKVILLFLLSFIITFLSIYAYILYTSVLSKRYEVSPAAALGSVVASIVVIMLFTLPLTMTFSLLTMGGGVAASSPF